MRVPFHFSFIHAADLHLDSPFRIHEAGNDALRKVLLDASAKAFSRLCEVAIERKVDFIILAGDIFDGPERGVRTQLMLRRHLMDLQEQGISVYIAFGNHDPLESSESLSIDWPKNLFTFPSFPERLPMERHGVKYAEITGVSYETREEPRNLAQLFPDAGEDVFNIAVLHANVGQSREHGNYAPAALADLKAKGYHYWALGHIHKREILCEDPLVIYPGNIQGLHMKPSERGLKGAEFVEVDETGVRHSFMPLSETIFNKVTVDVSGFQNVSAMIEGCLESIRHAATAAGGKTLVLSVDLVGTLEEKLWELAKDLEPLHDELRMGIGNLQLSVFIEHLDAHVLRGQGLEGLAGLSDVVSELIDVIAQWRKSPVLLAEFPVEAELRSVLVSSIKRAAIGYSLRLQQDDIDGAEHLLAELFREVGEK